MIVLGPMLSRGISSGGSRPVFLEGIIWDVGDAVDHHVPDLPVADQAQNLLGRDA